MPSVDLSAGVAVRLSEFCLDDNGRLRDYTLWRDAVRGAPMVDLAPAGRLVQTDDSIVVDGTATGFPPADRLLGAIAAENVASGRWTIHHWFFGRRYRATPYDWAGTSDQALDPGRPPEVDPPTAAVLALGVAIGATDPPPPGEELLARTGAIGPA